MLHRGDIVKIVLNSVVANGRQATIAMSDSTK